MIPRSEQSVLLTDLYQLAMLQSYFDHGINDTAVFEFFVRVMPPGRNFLMAGGLEQVLVYLENLKFTREELGWLATSGRFHGRFVDSLASLRFTGNVEAMPEGTVFFPNEPILRVVAPLREAQLVETRLINLLQFQTIVASKAARVRLAAPKKQLIDFGLRRAHGAEAGLLSARASYLAGFDGSSNVLAGMYWNIPLFGTMAHSFIQVHEKELTAFERFSRSHPKRTTLLIDTYDTEAAARAIVPLVRRLRQDNIHILAVRIDSGDLSEHAFRVREILDANDLKDIQIFASGNLDEFAVHDLVTRGAPIDGFGVGTRMNTSADFPYLDCAYKLQEYAGVARRKRSEGKATWPGRKQVLRQTNADGTLIGDTLTLDRKTNSTTDGEGLTGRHLLAPVMRNGHRTVTQPNIESTRDHARRELASLPANLRHLAEQSDYPVEIAAPLKALADEHDRRFDQHGQ